MKILEVLWFVSSTQRKRIDVKNVSTNNAREREAPRGVSLVRVVAYAAPVGGGHLFYAAIGQILPGIYAKYFGLALTSIAAVALFIRLFDAVIDVTIGYLSDLHRSTGGSRKPWVVSGSLGVIVACYFLFQPPQHVTTLYYLTWSLVYYLAFTVSEIPHVTWGSELSLDYQRRAQVFAVRGIVAKSGVITLYMLPLLPIYSSTAYTPEVLRDAVSIGALMTLAGLALTLISAPAGIAVKTIHEDSWRSLLHSLTRNKPLLVYLGAFGCFGLSAGMWFGLLYLYLDGYLGLADKVAIMMLVATIAAAVSTPLWLKLIQMTSKSIAWAVGMVLFIAQLIGMWFVHPEEPWWRVFGLLVVANLFFGCFEIAALSILGDIIDYGKMKFRKDRGATYFGFNTFVFKVGVGVGGGLSIGIAGLFGFDPAMAVNSTAAIFGLKLGFLILPACFAFFSLLFIWRIPIDRRRHRIIQRRIESRLLRAEGVHSG